jgi:hypothetical protein
MASKKTAPKSKKAPAKVLPKPKAKPSAKPVVKSTTPLIAEQKMVELPKQQPAQSLPKKEEIKQITQQKTSGFAITSFVLGMCFFIPFVTAILAIIFGIIGLDDVKKNNKKGKGLAISGIVLGALFFLFWVFVLWVFILFASMVPSTY